jgi:hypothetical protein
MATAIVLVETGGVHVNNAGKGGQISEIVKRGLSTNPRFSIKTFHKKRKIDYFIDNAASNPRI